MLLKWQWRFQKSLKIKEETEFSVYKGVDDVIVLVPKLENPFKKEIDLRMTNDFEGVTLLDNE